MRNFVIVGTQRTGSSALGEMIGGHPHVACGWEWTQYSPWRYKLTLAEQGLRGEFRGLLAHHRQHMAGAVHSGTAWIGYRRLFGASHRWLIHPRFSLITWRDRFEAHLAWFQRHPDLHIIHITRRDNLEWLKSKFLAETTKHFVGQPYPKGITITIPVGEAIARVQAKQWLDDRLSVLRQSNPYLQVAYEELLADREKVAQAAMAFLHCDPRSLPPYEPFIRRQSAGRAMEYVNNYRHLEYELWRRGMLGRLESDIHRDPVHEM